MRVHAVVVNWNGGEENLACIRSLLDQGLEQAEIVFVDNGSTSGSVDAVLEEFPDLTLVRNDSNTGFAFASNQGIEIGMERGAEYVFLVNNDVQIPPGCLAQLEAELAADPTLGIVAPRVLYLREPGTVWCAGGMINYHQNLTKLLGHRKPDGPRWWKTERVEFVPGCAMLIRRDVIERVGMFDAQFFAYHEDADLCVRAMEAGFGVACVGGQIAFHDPHSSTGGGYNPRRKYMMGVNSIWFLRRHGTPWRWVRFLFFDVLTLPLLILVAPFRGQLRAILAKGQGIFDGLRGVRVDDALVARVSRLDR